MGTVVTSGPPAFAQVHHRSSTTSGHYRMPHASHLARGPCKAGAECFIVRADLREPGSVDALLETVTWAEGQGRTVRGLVNCAAKLLSPSFAKTKPEDFDDYFAVNVKAPLFLAQALVPHMTGGGSIVNVSSASAHFSSPGDLVYAMSKAALESLTANAAEAVAAEGVRINHVIPGFTDNGHRAFNVPAARDYMSSFSVLGGISQPEEVAAAVLFLLSEEASRITGTGIDVSGGSTLGARGHRAGSISQFLQ
ncbi:SDR family NAD(P)-dependent oxidoreductase [Microbacterium lacticum]|uniref:SDR family NAD(P)-dependent oxidoreductase n=1 Tax=Microbacterium lacticum TaxID=33885 RepID=UPI001F57C4B0|nr:SDR family oxidoreductase [Microbacterium lacticum]